MLVELLSCVQCWHVCRVLRCLRRTRRSEILRTVSIPNTAQKCFATISTNSFLVHILPQWQCAEARDRLFPTCNSWLGLGVRDAGLTKCKTQYIYSRPAGRDRPYPQPFIFKFWGMLRLKWHPLYLDAVTTWGCLLYNCIILFLSMWPGSSSFRRKFTIRVLQQHGESC